MPPHFVKKLRWKANSFVDTKAEMEFCGMWKRVWKFFACNFDQTVLGLVLTLLWIQMYPCLFGLTNMFDVEPIYSIDSLLSLRIGNATETSFTISSEKLMGPYTFVCALVMFMVIVVHVAPTAVLIFCSCSSAVTLICMIAQGFSVILYNSLQVMPIISWIPIVYVRVNALHILLIYLVFGMRLLKKICVLTSCDNSTEDDKYEDGSRQSSDDDADDEEQDDCWKDCEASPSGWLVGSTTPQKADTVPGNKLKKGCCAVCTNCKFTPVSGRRYAQPKRVIGHSIEIEQGTGRRTAAFTRAIANILTKLNWQTKDYKEQIVDGEYGTHHFVGFPDYPPVIKPDGLPNTSPNNPKN